MKIADTLRDGPCFSFEFFPPRSEEGERVLAEAIRDLAPLAPAYVSVTYGAGGSTRERTHDLVVQIRAETGITPMAHLTCWIGLDDSTVANGAVHYVPGSHRWDLLPITGLAGNMEAIREVLDEEETGSL